MWIHMLRRIQPEINRLVHEDEAQCLEDIVNLLASTEALLSDVESERPGFMQVGGRLLARSSAIQSLAESISMGRKLTSAELIYLSHLATLYKLLEDLMDEFRVTIFRDEEIKCLITDMYQLLEHIPFYQESERILVEWSNDRRTLIDDIAGLLYVRACATMGILVNSEFYERIAEDLSFTSPFIIVYLVASCIKINEITLRVDVGSWPDSQYTSMMLLDTFRFLPGTAWG
jgi:hypothetical protein